MANKELRGWRVKAHNVIDPLWKSLGWKRNEVYEMLRKHFGRTIHIGESDIETCKKIIETYERK